MIDGGYKNQRQDGSRKIAGGNETSYSYIWFPVPVPTTFSRTDFYCLYPWVFHTWLQSMPREVIPSAICLDFTAESSVMGDSPAFSARAIGMSSRASAKLRTAYCIGKSIHTQTRQIGTSTNTQAMWNDGGGWLINKGPLITKQVNYCTDVWVYTCTKHCCT